MTSYLSGDVDKSVPRYRGILAEHLQIEQRTLAITVIELVLTDANKTHKKCNNLFTYLILYLTLKAAAISTTVTLP